ncbi:MAG: hypothetical protein A3A44_02640 [Candidatus Sungbacteria bacterium RIFCSPLOWO2_01_FULL_60_25]|uniref:Response regulatory domain-containing protein n=1 Tax=Candidatus Sungbacteria bacterium RIFCSPLOWO2_01_FULL_60_25 TaxID=1802281 RepID=A0A1G2LDR0_9BACT|nr:MAG: hypothetical protein A3A44_02640 [Candidatus Sungbacteria bacterium RIFCSPLOWO2_01_FULL_60_25]
MEKPKNILVIEDQPLIADILANALKRSGYAVTEVTTAEDAFAEMQRTRFDAILLDLVLPDMHGFEFLRAIKQDEHFREIPVIIASNVGDEVEIKKGLALGAASYIVKANVLPEDIIAAVAKTVAP